jgi:branched-subunit amino acid ABC-type transport system permease component
MLDIVNPPTAPTTCWARLRGADSDRDDGQLLAGWLVLAPLAVALIGAGIERSCLRPLYRRGPPTRSSDFGLIYVFEDLVKWI